MNPIHVIVNPTAGSGRGARVAPVLLERLRAATSAPVVDHFTHEAGEATTLAREAIRQNASMIVAVGGDGTINEVANGYIEDGAAIPTSCEMGIVNCGTGGGFAGTLHLPQTVEEQISLLFQPGHLDLDLGRVIYQTNGGGRESRLFVNECQTGIGSRVAEQVGKKHKLFGGTIAFGVTATWQALVMSPIRFGIRYDDGPAEELELIGLVIGNGVECAGGMKLTPDARPDDGWFDVLSIHGMNRIARLVNLTKVYSGSHLHHPKFTVKRCRKLSIQTDSPVTIEADGEVLGGPPFHLDVLPSAIRVKAGMKT